MSSDQNSTMSKVFMIAFSLSYRLDASQSFHVDDEQIVLGGMRVSTFMETYHPDEAITACDGHVHEVEQAIAGVECQHFVRSVVTTSGHVVLMGVDQCPSQTKYFTVGMMAPAWNYPILQRLVKFFGTLRAQVGADGVQRPFCDILFAEGPRDPILAYATPLYEIIRAEREALVRKTQVLADQFHRGHLIYGVQLGQLCPRSQKFKVFDFCEATNIFHCGSFVQELLATSTGGRLAFSFSANVAHLIYNPRITVHGAGQE